MSSSESVVSCSACISRLVFCFCPAQMLDWTYKLHPLSSSVTTTLSCLARSSTAVVCSGRSIPSTVDLPQPYRARLMTILYVVTVSHRNRLRVRYYTTCYFRSYRLHKAHLFFSETSPLLSQMRDWTRQQSEARRAKEAEEGEDMAAYWAYLERVRNHD